MLRNTIIAACVVLLAHSVPLMNAQSSKAAQAPEDAISQCCGRDSSDLLPRTFQLPARKLLHLLDKSNELTACVPSKELKWVMPNLLSPKLPPRGGSPEWCGFGYDGCKRVYFCTRG
jgi:hypothetical protein